MKIHFKRVSFIDPIRPRKSSILELITSFLYKGIYTRSMKRLLKKAEDLFASGKYLEAKNIYLRLIFHIKNPDIIKMAEEWARKFIEEKKYKEASEIYEALASLDIKGSLDSARRGAEVLTELGEVDLAWRVNYEIFKKSLPASLGDIFREIFDKESKLMNKDNKKVKKLDFDPVLLKKIIEADPKKALIIAKEFADRLVEKGEYAMAVRIYIELHEMNIPGVLDKIMSCIEKLVLAGKHDDAARFYIKLAKLKIPGALEKAIEQNGILFQKGTVLFTVGNNYMELAELGVEGALEKAEKCAEALIKDKLYFAAKIYLNLAKINYPGALNKALECIDRLYDSMSFFEAGMLYVELIKFAKLIKENVIIKAKLCADMLLDDDPYRAENIYEALAATGIPEAVKMAEKGALELDIRGCKDFSLTVLSVLAEKSDEYKGVSITRERLFEVSKNADQEQLTVIGFSVPLEDILTIQGVQQTWLLLGRSENQWEIDKEEAGKILEVLIDRKKELEKKLLSGIAGEERDKLLNEYRSVVKAMVNLAKWHNPALSEILSYSDSSIDELPDALAIIFYNEIVNLDNSKSRDSVMKYAMSGKCLALATEILIRKLVEDNYLDGELMNLIDERRTLGSPWEEDLADIRKVYHELGINPDREIMILVWGERYERTGVIPQRRVEAMIERIKSEKVKFEEIENPDELLAYLTAKKERAIIFYALYGGRTRYALVNDYNSIKFQQMLEKIKALRLHEGPIDEFRKALIAAGHTEAAVEEIIERLKKGQWPFSHPTSRSASTTYSRVIRVDVSHGGQLEQAQKQIADIFGNNQLGAILKYALYTRYLGAEGRDQRAELPMVNGIGDLPGWIAEVEKRHPEYSERAQKDLLENWKNFGEKLVLELSLHAVFTQATNPIDIQRMLEKLELLRRRLLEGYKADRNRGDIDDATKEKLLKLTQERNGINRTMRSLVGEEKERAIARLREITGEIKEIERRKREAQAEAGSKEWEEKIRILEEKGRDELLRFLISETIGETNELTQRLLEEWKSHVSGALDIYEKSVGGGDVTARREERQVRLRFLDRRLDFVELVRFADAAQCCFNSRNYMIGQGFSAADWVARLGRDPMSFVFAIEEYDPEDEKKPEEQRRRQAIGFVFGSFGVEDGMPIVLLNGVYMEGKTDRGAQSVINTIEEDFSVPLRVVRQYVAARYAGTSKYGTEYTNTQRTVRRLRALSEADGTSEVKIYDDLSVGVNQEGKTDPSVWHKEL